MKKVITIILSVILLGAFVALTGAENAEHVGAYIIADFAVIFAAYRAIVKLNPSINDDEIC